MENRRVTMNRHTNLLQLEEHMYPLVDVENTKRIPKSVSLILKYRRSHLMTGWFPIICRMISGSQIPHSEMDSSPGLLTLRIRS